jgi:hypothetical protein
MSGAGGSRRLPAVVAGEAPGRDVGAFGAVVREAIVAGAAGAGKAPAGPRLPESPPPENITPPPASADAARSEQTAARLKAILL